MEKNKKEKIKDNEKKEDWNEQKKEEEELHTSVPQPKNN